MASRRSGGGMGGPQRGNRSFSQHQPFQGSNVSPWQGNVPTNNSMNQGLISQLTSNPQQLALALTSLFQPQQQQINNPPSLLSLNTTPAFSNQDNDLNRFGRGRDFRRHEPYNKSRNGGGSWRPMDNNRNRNRNRDRRSSKDRSKDRKDNSRRNDKPKVNEKKDQEQEHNNTVEENRDEDVGEETKRDWKEEKNIPDVKKENDDVEQTVDDEQKKNNNDPVNRAGKYYDVPVKFLHCFVCNKEMWDGESMQKHIRGRAHKQMLNTLEESIAITVNILRENMRLAEEKKVIEWNRMHRLKKFNKYNEPQSHCNMCDLKFLGKIVTHRKTETHQRLKRYLHPTCNICNKEFPARIEWVEHRLTPEHLRKLNETLESKDGGPDGAVVVVQEEEEELDLEPLLEESLAMESENPVLELDDDLTGLQNLIPAYNPNRAISTKSLTSFTGFLCDLCNRSFDKEELAQAHLKTRRHYYAFIGAAKAKLQKQNEEAKKMEENKDDSNPNLDVKVEKENGEQGNDDDLYDPEEACNEEENSLGSEQQVKNEKQDENGEETEQQEENSEIIEINSESDVLNESEEEKTAPEMATRGKRRAAATKAGPKSKKLATTPATSEQTQTKANPTAQQQGISTNFRIPKTTGGAVKGGACPKSKKPQNK